MATHIHVVLTEDLHNVGKSGELVKVRPGFARNYLIPRGLAVGATAENVSRIEHEKRVAESRAAKTRSEAEQLAAKLNQVKLTISRPVGEGDKLYGSVTARDIEEALAAQGFSVDRRRIESDTIKTLGAHTVTLRLAPSITASVEVTVAAK
ncbi:MULTISPECIES: 50S ribosomal protein L9 [Sorangium]|uniref:Large ribosomal subunit protein bL9 n=1 Tax=Sorangium cellulosum TaxID=56 RepID=A0A150S3H0_SORCE|nr:MULTISPECIES: 50S ribosomal protein L9 [Sorangium]AUX36214.1 50S ribosomal protein L9 [Sorangium cellulosum]KYF87023.1 50S ribosomal protein L9 [Sorangium cellulosum]KYG01552.1 50S ribosomal protein L9 [Sorangium cellulosum]KYG10365.1 50S ribosomal protein L9 [Sorangium cellulosum]WCQ95516.1 50S ribosomal protein L9 [Sorangium sp. Soce836]